MTQLVPAGSTLFRSNRVAINIDYIGYVPAIKDLGAGNVEVLPPPKGPGGAQTARVVGNAWSILALSKNADAAWQVMRWLHTKEGMLGSGSGQMTGGGMGWPPLSGPARPRCGPTSSRAPRSRTSSRSGRRPATTRWSCRKATWRCRR